MRRVEEEVCVASASSLARDFLDPEHLPSRMGNYFKFMLWQQH